MGNTVDAMICSAEDMQIYFSNNKVVDLAIPLTGEGWLSVESASGVIHVSGFPEDVVLKAGEEGTFNIVWDRQWGLHTPSWEEQSCCLLPWQILADLNNKTP
eukprot:14917980-Ditylum_brightwellii.AAC.1